MKRYWGYGMVVAEDGNYVEYAELEKANAIIQKQAAEIEWLEKEVAMLETKEAGKRLDGYRELGATCARIQSANDRLTAELTSLREIKVAAEKWLLDRKDKRHPSWIVGQSEQHEVGMVSAILAGRGPENGTKIEKWVLKNPRKKQWFRDMTAAGPRYTNNIRQAAIFLTRREAMQSAGFLYYGSIVEPEELK